MQTPTTAPLRHAFTLVEVMIVVVIIGVLAAIVVPRFGSVTSDAKDSAGQSALGGVRAGIAGYRAQQILTGASPYPTAAQIETVGTVLQNSVPSNPWNGIACVQSVGSAQAASRTVSNPQSYGWNYYVDNSAKPPVAVFYANSTNETGVSDGAGGFKTANQL
ncbi:MAG: prepilin-type N-terminal cleavage/methylation domain-containing protein [Phycisphaerales bacterium]